MVKSILLRPFGKADGLFSMAAWAMPMQVSIEKAELLGLKLAPFSPKVFVWPEYRTEVTDVNRSLIDAW